MNKIKKAILFTSPVYTNKEWLDINPLPPMGLGYLAAVLRARGIEVMIFDSIIEGWEVREEIDDKIIRLGAPFAALKALIADFRPDLVGVNMLFTRQKENAHKIFSLAKSVNPKIVTIAGGPHATVMPADVLEDGNVDFVSIGEGERTIVDLVEAVEGRKNVTEIDGIAYRSNGATIIVPKTKFIMNLDELPFPAWDLMKLNKYFNVKTSHGDRKKERFIPVITSRGCPAKCTFCSAYQVWGRKYRYRSAENVLAEMKELKKTYDIQEIMFEDDNVTFDKQRAKRIFQGMIDNKLDFAWDTPNGVAAFALDSELIDLMKQSGCYRMNLALESGNQEVLTKIIKKPLNLERVKPLIAHAKKIGLNVGIFIIIGLPGEKIGQMRESFQLCSDLDIYNPHVSVATPYPGTELYDQCVKNGHLKTDFSEKDLFIRSYAISTDDWNGDDLQRVLFDGNRFLWLESLRKHPVKHFLEYAGRALRKPHLIPARLMKMLKGEVV